MKALLKKVRGDKKGFTLAELLVVVAIVAILVAISVPIFTAQLGKARKATNEANLRAAKVAAVAAYLTDEKKTSSSDTAYYTYNIQTGEANVVAKDKFGFTDKISYDDKKNEYTVTTTKVYESIGVEISSQIVDDNADNVNADVTLYAK